jgi:tetratricopeptide (TPR) repeat protein
MANYDSAIYYYSTVASRNPSNASAWFYTGVARYNKGMYTEAIETLKKAILALPRYADAYLFMGLSYVRLDKIDSVFYCIGQAENIAPLSAARQSASREYQTMGSEAYHNGNWQGALKYYQKAAEIKPDNAEAYYSMGGVYISRQDVNHAREFWKKTLSIDPQHKEAREWLGRIGG